MLLAGGSSKTGKSTKILSLTSKDKDPVTATKIREKLEPLVQAKTTTISSAEDREYEGLVSSKDLQLRLGLSRSHVFRLVHDLGLVAKVRHTGFRGGGVIHYFSPEQIESIVRRRAEMRQGRSDKGKKRVERITIREKEDGEIAKVAFRAFDAGLTPRKTVMEHGLSPEIVDHLWQQWQRLDGGAVFARTDMRALASFPWERCGAITGPKDLLDVIRHHFAILREESQCHGCRKGRGIFCSVCLRDKIAKVEAAYLGTATVG